MPRQMVSHLTHRARPPQDWESKAILRLRPLESSMARAIQDEPPCHQNQEDGPCLQMHQLQCTHHHDA
jgi:hypothetical protein